MDHIEKYRSPEVWKSQRRRKQKSFMLNNPSKDFSLSRQCFFFQFLYYYFFIENNLDYDNIELKTIKTTSLQQQLLLTPG